MQKLVPLCDHRFADGSTCGSPAIKHRHYCYWHRTAADRLRRTVREELAPRRRALPITVNTNPSDLLVNINHVLDAICQGRLTGREAGAILNGLSMATYMRHR